ncbi:hypothetical protein [Nocardia sp. NPDC127526]|uniref:hypothetical protein n=1 Tax=Nocardia sp. NPDC127526 TaxID=3345393 RepID=UPI0036299660
MNLTPEQCVLVEAMFRKHRDPVRRVVQARTGADPELITTCLTDAVINCVKTYGEELLAAEDPQIFGILVTAATRNFLMHKRKRVNQEIALEDYDPADVSLTLVRSNPADHIDFTDRVLDGIALEQFWTLALEKLAPVYFDRAILFWGSGMDRDAVAAYLGTTPHRLRAMEQHVKDQIKAAGILDKLQDTDRTPAETVVPADLQGDGQK